MNALLCILPAGFDQSRQFPSFLPGSIVLRQEDFEVDQSPRTLLYVIPQAFKNQEHQSHDDRYQTLGDREDCGLAHATTLASAFLTVICTLSQLSNASFKRSNSSLNAFRDSVIASPATCVPTRIHPSVSSEVFP